MAIAKQGVNGSFSGKIGSVIGYELNGQNVIRSVGSRRKRTFTELERLNQMKMKMVSEYLAHIRPFLLFGFKREAPKGSRIGPFQLAQSHARKHAVEVDNDGSPYINPAHILISSGPLDPPLKCIVTREANFLHLQWQMMLNQGANDRLVVLVYDGDIFRYFLDTGIPRSQLQATIEISSLEYLEKPAHVYATFWDPILDQISDSVFCGTILPETTGNR